MVKNSKLNDFSIATWNGCGWNAQIEHAFSSSVTNCDITVLTEMKQREGDAVLTGRLLKSGGDEKDPAAGVGLLLSSKAQKAMLFATAISPRILMARFSADNRDITVIAVYIPHQGRKVEPFQASTYAELEKVIAMVPKSDCLVVAGDFNSRLERSWIGNDFKDARFVGRWSIHSRDCPGGVILRDLLHKHDLCAISTRFEPYRLNHRRRRNNSTWINPTTGTKPSQIDHILVSNRWKSSFTNSQIKWGPSINRWGEKRDHGVVVARSSLRTRMAHTATRRFTTDKLKVERTRLTFAEAVRLRIADNEHERMGVQFPIPLTVDGRWRRLKDAIVTTARDVLKPDLLPYKVKSYMSENTATLVSERISTFAGINAIAVDSVTAATRKEWTKKISKSLRVDWATHVTAVVREMEAADAVGNIQKLHELAGRLQGKGKRTSSNISTDEVGRPLVTETERLAVWQRYFAAKFAPAPDVLPNPATIPIPIPSDVASPPSINMDPPTRKEVEEAINWMKKGRSPGVDEIPIELISACPTAIDEMTSIVIMIWEEETLPDDWWQGLMVNIYKGKGSKNAPVSYRPICLLVHAYKAFAILLLRRMKAEIDARIRRGQEGFRTGRGCSDNLYVLRAAINYALRIRAPVEMTFIDFTQAFDTVSHSFLDIAMDEHCVPPKYRRLVQMIYAHATARIKGPNGSMSEPFPVKRGVLQGDILSPILFVLVLNSMWVRTKQNQGWQITPSWLLDELSYADDCVLIEGPCIPGPLQSSLQISPPPIIKSQQRLQEFSDIGKGTSTMRISIPKTFRMKIEPAIKLTATTATDVIEMNFEVKCEHCGRQFPNKNSLPKHYPRYCKGPGTGNDRPYRNQLANKLVEEKKRAAIVSARPNIILDLQKIENVAQFRYLGALVAGHGSDEGEIKARIRKSQAIFNSHSGIWSDKNLPLELKIRLFKVRVLSALLYGGESWTMSKRILQNLRGFAGRCHIKMANTSFLDRRRGKNNTMGQKLSAAIKAIDITRMLEKRRWAWLGHVLRMDTNRNPRRAVELQFGAPNALTDHLPATIRNIREATLMAADRENWDNIFQENRFRTFENLYHAMPDTDI
jgi:exonuclease III